MLLSPVKKILVNMCGIVKKPYLLLNTWIERCQAFLKMS